MSYTLDYLTNLEKINDTTEYLSKYYLPEVKVLSFTYPNQSSSSNINLLANKLNTRFNWFAFGKSKITDNGIFQYSPVSAPNNLFKLSQNFISNYLYLILHDLEDLAQFNNDEWQAYKACNESIAYACQNTYSNSLPNIYWLNNFELALVPPFLANQKGSILCQFIHTSWPKFKPLKKPHIIKEIIQGLLNNNLIGFQSKTYLENFLTYVNYLIPKAKIDTNNNEIGLNGHTIKLIANPLGIDFRTWQKFAKFARPHSTLLKQEHKLANQIILGVDKLCPSKGIIEKLSAFDLFLAKNQQWQKRIHYVQILGKPTGVGSIYENYATNVMQSIAKINNKYRINNWEPIKLIKQELTQQELASWYQASDALLINSIADGLNLVAKEYIASRIDEQGVLILSQNTGCANETAHGALIINPHNPDNIVNSIEIALSLDPEEKKRRMNLMRYAVNYNQLQDWVVTFLESAINTTSLGV